MPYEFFFSYTRANNENYLRTFFKNLSEAICLRRGFHKDTVVGFLDQQDIERGEQWDATLAQALQSSKILVSLYTPAYLRSVYCGREWRVFHQRRELYVKRKKETEGIVVALPPVIKPVVWFPLDGTPLPPLLQELQYTIGDPSAPHNSMGMRKMRMQYRKFKIAYDDYIDKLADEILDAADNHPLPELPSLPSLNEVQSAFHSEPSTSNSPQQDPPTSGPNFVQFVFVAAKPSQLQELKQKTECYLQNGGNDWKPFWSERPKRIGALAQNVASSDDLDFSSAELPFSNQLVQQILDAEKKRNIVVLLVDSWTAALQEYRKILQAFDRQNYFNCSVMVPWNNDAETQQQRAQLEQTIRQTFHFRASTSNSL